MTTHKPELVKSWPGSQGYMVNGKVRIGADQGLAVGAAEITGLTGTDRDPPHPGARSKETETGEAETGR